MLGIASFKKSVQKNPRVEQVQQFLNMISFEADEKREDIRTTCIELYISRIRRQASNVQ